MVKPGKKSHMPAVFRSASLLPEGARGPGGGGFPWAITLFFGKKEAQTFFSHPQITTIINKESAAPVYITSYTGMAWFNRMQRSGT
jgi:hypothetical protein